VVNAIEKAYKKRRSWQYVTAKTVVYAVLIFFTLVVMIPFVFALSTSFTTPVGIYSATFNWIPKPITIENYVNVFSQVYLIRGFANTMMYILPPILVGTLSSAMGAYALSRLRFPGKNVIFFGFLSTMVIPGVITMIPSYVMFAKFYHWTNTPWPLIVPGMFGSAMTMFFIRQFFMTIPKELEEAARIDGMTRWGIFFKIYLPLSKPVLITQIILSFNGAYNDYLGPLLYVGTVPEFHTLQLMLSNLQTKLSSPYTLMMAGAMIALVPTFVLYIFCQRYFVEGIVMTGIKG
jgi:multiple sugar transport system permease protein